MACRSRARSARASNLNQIQHANSIVIFTASSYSRGGGRGRGCSFHFHLHNQHYRKTIIIFAASFVSQIHHQPSKRRYMLGSKELQAMITDFLQLPFVLDVVSYVEFGRCLSISLNTIHDIRFLSSFLNLQLQLLKFLKHNSNQRSFVLP